MKRVIVVLGYSHGRRGGELHPACAARLARAAEIARPEDMVVLSGWARVRHTPSEAALMAAAWSGDAAALVVDADARTTAENAANAVRHVVEAGASEVIVVTSPWHGARARAAFRFELRGTGACVHVVTSSEPAGRRRRARELALWPLLPAQLVRARRRRAGLA